MNVLFLTLIDMQSISEHGIYEDLMREFVKNGHEVYIASPTERRNGKETHIIKEDGCTILKVKTGNVQKTGIIEKGISTLLLGPQIKSAIKKYLKKVRFDLVLYSTPPITIEKIVMYIKKRDKAVTYLMLKDIFPQNAVDMGMFSAHGIIYKYFRMREKKLYQVSDFIGCMSQANIEYVLKHNPQVEKDRVELCPNSIEIQKKEFTDNEKADIRKKYGIPLEKKVFVYGGNLGKPQGIDFLIKCIEEEKDNDEIYFLLVGNGTEYTKLEKYLKSSSIKNVKLLSRIPKEEYDGMIYSCDVGLVFLDYNFTIPNFPSRILSYMQAKLPIWAITDVNTDLGKIIEENEFGWWTPSNDVESFSDELKKILSVDGKETGEKGFNYLVENYSVAQTYKNIARHLK